MPLTPLPVTLGHPRPLRRGRGQLIGVAGALMLIGALGAIEARTPRSVTIGGLLVFVAVVSTWLFSTPAAIIVTAAAVAVPIVAYEVGSDDLVVGEVEVVAIAIISIAVHLAIRAVERYEGLLATHNAELLEVNASLERFTADAAHEFRAPLAVVLSEVDLALGRAGSVADYRRHLETIHAEVTHMRRTITGLLTLARADAGVLQASFRRVDLVDLLEELMARRRSAAAPPRVSVDSALPEQGTIVCDPDLIVRVVDNLLDNALRAVPDGGRVDVAAHRDDGDWLLVVSNTGPAIAPDALAMLDGDGGSRGVPARRSRESGGGGLGLALCAAIVRAHKGSIRVESGSTGTSFVVRLPAGAQ